MSTHRITFSAEQLERLLGDAAAFRSELFAWKKIEQADAETVVEKRHSLRFAVVKDLLRFAPQNPSRQEVDLMFGMVREAARIALAERSAAFRVMYGIALTCGEAPPPSAP